MEIKKSKGANLENHRLTYLLMGFVFALSVIYVCFEYTDKEIEIYDNQTVAEIIEEDIQIDQTIQEETPPPPPEPEPPSSVIFPLPRILWLLIVLIFIPLTSVSCFVFNLVFKSLSELEITRWLLSISSFV